MQNPKLMAQAKKTRKDLVGTDFEYFIDLILEGVISVYHTGNFLFLLDTPFGNRRKSEKDLASKVDDVIKENNFNLKKYNNIDYIRKDKEAHKKAFPIYLKVHEKFKVPYEHLLSASYLDKIS